MNEIIKRQSPVSTIRALLGEVNPGTKIIYTLRGREKEYQAALTMVIADAIVVELPVHHNPVLVRIEAIDTLELIHESS